jgi:hypothetical protein
MTTIALVGIDLGKRTFNVHAQDGHSNEVLRRQLNRIQLIRWLANLLLHIKNGLFSSLL